MLWQNLREEEFYDAIEECGKVCVIPVGCVEMHGQHLPVGTDTMTCQYIAEKAAETSDMLRNLAAHISSTAENFGQELAVKKTDAEIAINDEASKIFTDANKLSFKR